MTLILQRLFSLLQRSTQLEKYIKYRQIERLVDQNIRIAERSTLLWGP